MIIIIVLLLALFLRLFLAPLGFHIDILSTAGWGQWIYQNGPLGFYENNVWLYAWPTQPPVISLIHGFNNWLYIFILEAFRSIGNTIVKYHLAPGHMIWWFNLTKWFDTAKTSGEAAYSIGYLVSIKLLPIFADLGIAAIVYKIAKSLKTIKFPSLWPVVYLFSPYSFYLSALWGQYDQLAYLVVLLAFIFESGKKFSWLTPFIFALSVFIKPTTLIFAPFFAYLYFKNKHKLINPTMAFVIIVGFFIVTTSVFTNQDLVYFTFNDLYTKIFLKSASRLSANTFNLWGIISSSKINTQDMKILFLPAYFWSILSFLILNITVFVKTKKVSLENTFKGIFIIGVGSWLFMTNMLDRYLFTGLTTGLILCLYNKKLFKYWLTMSFVFWLNLYNQWWFPDSFDHLKNILTWENGLITKILSLVNIGLFLKMASLLI